MRYFQFVSLKNNNEFVYFEAMDFNNRNREKAFEIYLRMD